MFLAFKKYGASSMYEDWIDDQDETDITKLALDEVTVAGVVKPGAYSALGAFPFLKDAVQVLTDAARPAEILQRPLTKADVDYNRRVSERWRGHAEDLARFSLTAKIGSGEVRFISRYFAVRKRGKNGRVDTARSIFNGRELSKLCRSPPPVCLPEIPEILSAMAKLHQACAGKNGMRRAPRFLTADLRHWFHQIEVSAELRRMFCLSFNENQFVAWQTLPMGWSWSPRLAQCLCWGLILGLQKDAKHGWSLQQVRSECMDLPNPPAYVYLRNKNGVEVGLAFCWYDNITIMSFDDAAFTDTCCCLTSNMKHTKAVWKEYDVHDDISCPTSSCSFLGINVGVSMYKRERDKGAPPTEFMWRHNQDNIKRAAKIAVSTTSSKRHVAKALGFILWDAYMSAAPLFTIESFIDMMRANSASSGRNSCQSTDSHWNAPTPLNDEVCQKITDKLKEICCNSWRTVHSIVRAESTVYLACDSSDKLGGEVEIDVSGSFCTLSRPIVWSDSFRERAHIFLKELLAAVLTIERAIMRHPSCTRIVLVCDNTAACHVLRKMYSNNRDALELVHRVHNALLKNHATLVIVGIRGIDNIADCPTRGMDLDPGRLARTWDQICAHPKGYRLEVAITAAPRANFEESDERHVEPSESDEKWTRMDLCEEPESEAPVLCVGEVNSAFLA